jgi:hypothetical protein
MINIHPKYIEYWTYKGYTIEKDKGFRKYWSAYRFYDDGTFYMLYGVARLEQNEIIYSLDRDGKWYSEKDMLRALSLQAFQ